MQLTSEQLQHTALAAQQKYINTAPDATMPRQPCSTDTNDYQAVFQQAESSAYPAVFRGLNKSWPALQRWAGLEGLHHLQAAAGNATVQAMYARSSEFFGDIQHHTSVECSLRQLLDLAAQQQQQQQQLGLAVNAEAAAHAGASTPAAGAAAGGSEFRCPNLYLAQQSLQEPGLSRLLEDVPVPELLLDKQLTSVNMWFSSRCSRSSLHHDPHQNLLCVVTGCKRVRIYPPAATLGLYPRSLGGEASNHSSVNFARPDFVQHPLYRHVLRQCITVSLQPGDALFLPEGWWHQVDSEEMTFAVNFWWSSQLTSQLRSQSHQHHYYLRQLLASTSREAVQQLLDGIQPWQPPQPDAAAAAAEVAQGLGQASDPDVHVIETKTRQSKRRKRSHDCDTPAAVAGSGMETQQEAAQHAEEQPPPPLPPPPLQQQQQQQQPIVNLSRFETAALQELLLAALSTHDHSSAKLLQQQQQQQQQQQLRAPVEPDLHAGVGPYICQAQPECQSGSLGTAADAGSTHPAAYAGSTHPAADAGSTHRAADLAASLLVDERWWQQQASAQQALLANSMQQGQGVAATTTTSSSSSSSGTSSSSSSEEASIESGDCSRRSDEECSSEISSDSQSLSSSSSDRRDGGRCRRNSRMPQEKGLGGSSSDRLGLRSRLSKLLAALQPEQLLRVLWVASAQHAAAVAQLLLHGLSPAAAQMLTQRLEQADTWFSEGIACKEQQQRQQVTAAEQLGQVQQDTVKQHQASGGTGSETLLGHVVDIGKGRMPLSRANFYAQLYGCVQDPGAVLAVMLAGKTRLTAAAADMITSVHMGSAT